MAIAIPAFDLAQWQQAKRAGKDAREIKRVYQEARQISDTGPASQTSLSPAIMVSG